IMCESKKGVSALQLKRMLKIGSYETAWFLCHRIRAAMVDEGAPLLHGIVEVDETYVGGKTKGPWLSNKTMVMGAIERDGRLRVKAMTDHSWTAIRGFVTDTVHDDAEAIYTDSHRAYDGIGDKNTRHGVVEHSADEWVNGDIHT